MKNNVASIFPSEIYSEVWSYTTRNIILLGSSGDIAMQVSNELVSNMAVMQAIKQNKLFKAALSK